MSENSSDEIKKTNSNLKNIIIIFAFAIIAIILLQYDNIRSFILNNNYNKYEDYYEEYDKETHGDYNYNVNNNIDERLDCFELDFSKLENEKTGLLLNNKSKLAFSDLELNIIFYDGNKRPISIERIYIECILPNSKWAGTSLNFPEEYETYDFLVTASNYNLNEKVQQFKSVKFNQVFDSDTNMSVKFENNYKEKINSANVVAIYYDKDGNVIYIEDFYVFDLKPKKSEQVESYEYLDLKKQKDVVRVETILVNVNIY